MCNEIVIKDSTISQTRRYTIVKVNVRNKRQSETNTLFNNNFNAIYYSSQRFD